MRKEVSHDKGLNLDYLLNTGKRQVNWREEKNVRHNTLLKSNIVKVKPQIDLDKKVYLNEMLKLLGYADMYYK